MRSSPFLPYSGLGGPAFYFKLAEAGITGQGLTVISNGTHFYGASVETSKITKSQLGSLAKLAESSRHADAVSPLSNRPADLGSR